MSDSPPQGDNDHAIRYRWLRKNWLKIKDSLDYVFLASGGSEMAFDSALDLAMELERLKNDSH